MSGVGKDGRSNSATAFAPATVANVAVGFDILGFAIAGVGDRVTVTKISEKKIVIEGVHAGARVAQTEDSDFENIPTDPRKNTAGFPLVRMLEDLNLSFGFSVKIEKGIALGSGMGGSAASAVGAVVAANALLDHPLSLEELIGFALEGEAVASGSFHADNIAPCLYGGFTLSQPGKIPDVQSLPYPKDLLCVVVHPKLRLDTIKSRGVLSTELKLKTHIEQSRRLASFIAGICTDNFTLIKKGCEDVLIEPQRASLIPGFSSVKAAAIAAGALGVSISGAGPSMFAFARGEKEAHRIREEMITAFREEGGLPATGWVSPILARGAYCE